jgi:hypothetical protein
VFELVDKDFNKSMSSYLDAKRKKDSNIIQKVQIFKKEKKDNITELYPDLKEGETHIIDEKESFFSKLKAKFLKKEEKIVQEDIDSEIIDKQIQKEYTNPIDEFSKEEEEINAEIKSSPTFVERIKKFFSRATGKEKEESIYEEMIYEELTEEDRLKHELAELERRAEEIDVERNEIEHKKQHVIKKFLRNFENTKKEVSRHKNQEYISLEEFNRIEEDLIEVSKIATFLIRNLTRRKLDMFKESDEFIRFKTILKERKIIRE